MTYTIPKADTPSVKAYHNGDSTGFFNISWKKLKAPKAIKCGFITGKNIKPFRSAMQPLGAQEEKDLTKAEIDSGKYKLHTDGKGGSELALNPSPVYKTPAAAIRQVKLLGRGQRGV